MKHQYQISTDDLYLISRVLNNDAEEEEIKLFEEKSETEADFKLKIEEIRLLITGVREANLASDLETFHKKVEAEKKQATKIRRINTSKFTWWAAAAMVVIFSGMWIFYKAGNNDNIYTKFYKPDPGLPTLMSSTDNYDFEKAMVDYKMGDYAKAIASWEILLKNNPQNDSLVYFLGSAYLANKEPEKAKPLFENMLLHKESEFVSDTYWYLGLIYIDENKIQKGKELIEQSNHQNKENILEIIKKDE